LAETTDWWVGDDGSDDDAICDPEGVGAVVATCGFTEGSTT
jgi:hypothetical protein